MYLADNAGEIAFDRLLIEQLPANRVALVVRGGPIINDATLVDARAVGLHEIVEVIDNGSDAPGTILEDCSAAFRERFEQADLVIAKGQGNFETLSDVRRPIRFLLKAKCPVIARHAGVPMGTHLLLNQPTPGRRPVGLSAATPPTPVRTSAARSVRPDRSPSECRGKESMSRMTIPEDLQRCIDFHGHLCPGLVVGYCAAKFGMQRLAAKRSSDEDLIAIVENDSCAVDAVQVLTGCTFGKGNLFLRDYGKMVFTLAARPTGRSVRLCLRFNAPPEVDEVPAGEVRRRKVEHILAQKPEQLFCIREEPLDLPQTARIHDSVLCQECGEMVMITRTRSYNCSTLCVPCAEYRISQME